MLLYINNNIRRRDSLDLMPYLIIVCCHCFVLGFTLPIRELHFCEIMFSAAEGFRSGISSLPGASTLYSLPPAAQLREPVLDV